MNFKDRAKKYVAEKNLAWENYLIDCAHAGYNVKNSVTNRSMFMNGYHAGKENTESLEAQLAQAIDYCDSLQREEAVREATRTANDIEQTADIRTAAEALVAALTKEADDYDGLVEYAHAKELNDLQAALSRGWLARKETDPALSNSQLASTQKALKCLYNAVQKSRSVNDPLGMATAMEEAGKWF